MACWRGTSKLPNKLGQPHTDMQQHRKRKGEKVALREGQLLAEAMKQPGVAKMLDVYSQADKYVKAVAVFEPFVGWQTEPSFASASHAIAGD